MGVSGHGSCPQLSCKHLHNLSFSGSLLEKLEAAMDVASNTQDLARLIGSLYEAAFSPDLLTGLAPKIAEVFGSSSTVLKTYRADSEVDLLESTDNMLLGARDQGLAEYWHRNDLWVQRSEAGTRDRGP
jgi:hypothetical protein